MSRIIKIINNKYVQIEEYRIPNMCFKATAFDEYKNLEEYCILKEIFDLFEIFYKNEELKNKINILEYKNQEINKQLEDANKKIFLLKHDKPTLYYKKVLEETQQKEFIKYLENMIDNDEYNTVSVVRVKDVLQKFKSIIGGKNE